VIQRGNNRQAIVRGDADRRAWRDILAEALEQHAVSLQAYVLMDNHFHLLLTPPSAQALSRLMQTMGRRYVGAHNAAHGRSGTLWEGRFKCSPVETDRYFLACMRYIELNPVRAGLVGSPQEWAWSSAAHHLGLRQDRLVADHPTYWALGNTPFERERRYRDFLEAGTSERDAARITEAALKGWALGSPEFLRTQADAAARPLEPRRRGRPRKDPTVPNSPEPAAEPPAKPLANGEGVGSG
jgi:putative transposase